MDDYVNQDLAVKIIEVDIEKQRLVFSARKATNDKQLEEYNVSDQLVGCTAMTFAGRAYQCSYGRRCQASIHDMCYGAG